MSDQLFVHCVRIIKRWPRINASRFPSLPAKCNFIVCGPSDGRYKLEVNNKVYSRDDYIKTKKALKLNE